MKARPMLISAIAVVALALAGNALAETQADATAKAAHEISSVVANDAQAAQDAADLAVDGENAVNAARDLGAVSSYEAEEADLAAEGASAAAADIMDEKIITREVAKEAAADAAFKDAENVMQGD